jgi:DNA mismatch endonuclease (patch repair protein)
MVAVFVDGCFWHMCQRHFRLPKSNVGYWHPKLKANVKRDRAKNKSLRREGWTVIRIWEHDINDDIGSCVNMVLDLLHEH